GSGKITSIVLQIIEILVKHVQASVISRQKFLFGLQVDLNEFLDDNLFVGRQRFIAKSVKVKWIFFITDRRDVVIRIAGGPKVAFQFQVYLPFSGETYN